MKYLLDTCVISDFVKGDQNVMTRLKSYSPDDLAISSVTAMEIEFGLQLNPARAKKIQSIIRQLLVSVHILPFETSDAVATAKIRAILQKQGRPIGPYDVMIAGTALSRSLIMVTSNTKEFNRVEELELQDWRLSQ